MEDPDEEWEETSAPGESGKVARVLRKGFELGKKIAISGIVISSAPLIIPPLVIYSTVGLALSVPFGFYFSSYACTEKLMSTLLSPPTTTHTSEYGIHYDDECCGDEGKELRVGEVVDYGNEVETGDRNEVWEETPAPGESGTMGWALTKGFGLGKKIAISGIMISAAPLVIPPLVIYSTMGLALSVPFGFYFSSYACTEKLMSTLLSTPTHYDDEFGGHEGDEFSVGEVVDYEKEVEVDAGGFDQEWKHIEEAKPVDDFSRIVVKEGYEEPDESLALDEIDEHLNNISVQPLEEIGTKSGKQKRDENVDGFEDKADFEIVEESTEEHLNDITMQPLEEIETKLEKMKRDENVDGFEDKADFGIVQEPAEVDLLEENIMPLREINNAIEVDKKEGQTEPLAVSNPNDQMQIVETVTESDEKSNADAKVGEPLLTTVIVNEEIQDAAMTTDINNDLVDENPTDMKVEGEKEVGSFSYDENGTEPLLKECKKPNLESEIGKVVIVRQRGTENDNNANVGETIIVTKVVREENKDAKPETYIKERNFANVDEVNTSPVKEIILKFEGVRRTGSTDSNMQRMEPVIGQINVQKAIERDLNEQREKPFGKIDLTVNEQNGTSTLDIVEEVQTEPAVERIEEPKPVDAIRVFVSAMQDDNKISEPIGVTEIVDEEHKGGEKSSDFTSNIRKQIADTESEVGEGRNDNVDCIEEIPGLKDDIVKDKIPEKSIRVEEADKMARGEESSKKRKTENNTPLIYEAPEAAVEKEHKRNAGKSFSARLKKPIRKMQGSLRTSAKKNSNKHETAKEPGTEINNGLIPKVVKPVEEAAEILKTNIESNDIDSIVEVEMPHEEAKQTTEDGKSVSIDPIRELDDNDVLKRTDDGVLSDTDEGLELKKTREDIGISNVELTDIAQEAGLDLVDNKYTADEGKSGSVMEITEGTLPLTSYTDGKILPSVDPSSTESPSRKKSATAPFPKVKSDDKIGEKIGALRTIVGEDKSGSVMEINNGLIPKVVKPVEEAAEVPEINIESKDTDSLVEVEMPQKEAKQTTEDGKTVNKDPVRELEDKDILKRTDDSVLSDMDEGLELKGNGEDIEISNAELTDIGHEVGVDLVDDKCTAEEDKSGSVMENTEGTLPLTTYTDEKILPGVDRSSLESPSRKSATMPSPKVKSEDKIGEKIGALRAIVGYSIAPQATLLEKLKALYIFTGVEPPVSSKDASNPNDIEDRLRFLMSIVGVK